MGMESIPKTEDAKQSDDINLHKLPIGGKESNKYDKYREMGWTDEEIREEMIYNAADRYDKDKFSEEALKDWTEKYSVNSTSFFYKENYEILKEMPQEKRLINLARASCSLRATPDMASEYFARFPEDLEVIKIIFEKGQGYPGDNLDNKLFSISALNLDKENPELKKRYSYLNDYTDIAQKRNSAPELLMNNFKENGYVDELKKYGKGAEGFLELLGRADDVSENMRYPINPEYMLTEDFKGMDVDSKAEFLRECVRTIQYCLVFEEVFNSRFTKKGEEEEKRAVIEQIKRGNDIFNERHSMIFKTYHPVSIYKVDQGEFDHELNYTAEWGGGVEEHPYEKILLVVLNELKEIESQKSETADTLVEFWNKNRNPVFGNAVSDALSKQNPERASSRLLKLIKDEKEDKRPLAAILYRLEFGKIGISEEGVNYLEKMYDLGEYNNPDYHVSRLTSDGEVGLFDEDLKLIKYFHLGDLSTEENKVQADVIDFVYETLYYGKSDESAAERIKREKYLQDFKENYYRIANENVFNQTGVRLNNLSFKEQGWFVIYYNQASVKERDDLKGFVQKYGEKGIKTFLSLESGGEEMGGKILEMGEKLEDQPEIADALFSEYAKVIDRINENAEELCKIYEEIFFEKKLDKSEVSQAIVGRANNLLLDGSDMLEKANPSDQKVIIEKIIKEFRDQTLAGEREIGEFRDMAGKLNSKYREIYLDQESLEEGDRNFEEWLKSEDSKDIPEEERKKILSIHSEGKKFDSDRIKDMIVEAKNNYKEHAQPDYSEYNLEIIPEKNRSGMTFFNEEVARFYKEKIDKLQKLLPFQIAFEKKLESLILGKETASLNKDMFEDIDEKARKLVPEKFPSEKQTYFPVGISSNLPEWENIFEGKEKMAKPMDIYGYMFWLNNQNRNIKLVVCDQMQASNYEALYGKSHNDALEIAKKIGEKERRFYQKIIDTFGLINIEIMDYESFVGRNKDEFEKYRTLCERLSKNPILKKAFSDMIQESVSRKTSDEEKKNLLKYAIEEVSWILSFDGVKVSHIKETRYDSLASIISNTKNICGKNEIDIFDPASEQKMMTIIGGVTKELKNIYNTNKLKLEKEKGKDSCDVQYCDRMHRALSNIKYEKEKNEEFEIDRRDINTNFICPTVGSFSFGWRGGKKDEKESTLKFKEAYSTYFCKGGVNLFLDSDQVVTSPKGHIGGKILTLENEKQRLYAEKVIKPILIEYFKAIESAPEEYFAKIKKTKGELLSECKDSVTLSDILKFIQSNIMEPTFSK
ncbi:MAG: hypothetical protein WC788_05340 [Candidatus Paceibacterota bacterium]|jgi:hypothetical protein